MSNSKPPEWKIDKGLVPYEEAVSFMEDRAKAIRDGGAADCIWLLEHPPLYTAGTSANRADLLTTDLPVYETGRGGQYTYHGPGQRIAYAMMDLQKRGADLRTYIFHLEEWIIKSLALLGVQGERRGGRVGIWIDMSRHGKPTGTEAKIAAIGVRVRKWVTYHGLSINLSPDLSHYNGIVPCGISQHGVTSLSDLGVQVSVDELDDALCKSFDKIFVC
jgi:lipoyl(octanoyl) transferase